MNNSNFGIDCRNNIDNCKFESIYHEIGEMSFTKKFENIFGSKNQKDVSCIETMREEIEQTYNEKLLTLDPNDLTFEARKYSLNVARAKNLDALKSMDECKKKNNKKRIFLDIDQKIENSRKSFSLDTIVRCQKI